MPIAKHTKKAYSTLDSMSDHSMTTMLTTSSISNPLKEDSNLTQLLKQLETVHTRRQYKAWKKSFLARFQQFLTDDGSEKAMQAYQGLVENLSPLIALLQRLRKHFTNHELTDRKVTVKARQTLAHLQKRSNSVAYCLKALLPKTMEDEQKCGYSKFHMGAVLIRDGFHDYARLALADDIFGHLVQTPTILAQADRQFVDELRFFKLQLEIFCGVLADLGLKAAMEKSRQVSKYSDEEIMTIMSDGEVDDMTLSDEEDDEINHANDVESLSEHSAPVYLQLPITVPDEGVPPSITVEATTATLEKGKSEGEEPELPAVIAAVLPPSEPTPTPPPPKESKVKSEGEEPELPAVIAAALPPSEPTPTPPPPPPKESNETSVTPGFTRMTDYYHGDPNSWRIAKPKPKEEPKVDERSSQQVVHPPLQEATPTVESPKPPESPKSPSKRSVAAPKSPSKRGIPKSPRKRSSVKSNNNNDSSAQLSYDAGNDSSAVLSVGDEGEIVHAPIVPYDVQKQKPPEQQQRPQDYSDKMLVHFEQQDHSDKILVPYEEQDHSDKMLVPYEEQDHSDKMMVPYEHKAKRSGRSDGSGTGSASATRDKPRSHEHQATPSRVSKTKDDEPTSSREKPVAVVAKEVSEPTHESNRDEEPNENPNFWFFREPQPYSMSVSEPSKKSDPKAETDLSNRDSSHTSSQNDDSDGEMEKKRVDMRKFWPFKSRKKRNEEAERDSERRGKAKKVPREKPPMSRREPRAKDKNTSDERKSRPAKQRSEPKNEGSTRRSSNAEDKPAQPVRSDRNERPKKEEEIRKAPKKLFDDIKSLASRRQSAPREKSDLRRPSNENDELQAESAKRQPSKARDTLMRDIKSGSSRRNAAPRDEKGVSRRPSNEKEGPTTERRPSKAREKLMRDIKSGSSRNAVPKDEKAGLRRRSNDKDAPRRGAQSDPQQSKARETLMRDIQSGSSRRNAAPKDEKAILRRPSNEKDDPSSGSRPGHVEKRPSTKTPDRLMRDVESGSSHRRSPPHHDNAGLRRPSSETEDPIQSHSDGADEDDKATPEKRFFWPFAKKKDDDGERVSPENQAPKEQNRAGPESGDHEAKPDDEKPKFWNIRKNKAGEKQGGDQDQDRSGNGEASERGDSEHHEKDSEPKRSFWPKKKAPENKDDLDKSSDAFSKEDAQDDGIRVRAASDDKPSHESTPDAKPDSEKQSRWPFRKKNDISGSPDEAIPPNKTYEAGDDGIRIRAASDDKPSQDRTTDVKPDSEKQSRWPFRKKNDSSDSPDEVSKPSKSHEAGDLGDDGIRIRGASDDKPSDDWTTDAKPDSEKQSRWPFRKKNDISDSPEEVLEPNKTHEAGDLGDEGIRIRAASDDKPSHDRTTDAKPDSEKQSRWPFRKKNDSSDSPDEVSKPSKSHEAGDLGDDGIRIRGASHDEPSDDRTPDAKPDSEKQSRRPFRKKNDISDSPEEVARPNDARDDGIRIMSNPVAKQSDDSEKQSRWPFRKKNDSSDSPDEPAKSMKVDTSQDDGIRIRAAADDQPHDNLDAIPDSNKPSRWPFSKNYDSSLASPEDAAKTYRNEAGDDGIRVLAASDEKHSYENLPGVPSESEKLSRWTFTKEADKAGPSVNASKEVYDEGDDGIRISEGDVAEPDDVGRGNRGAQYRVSPSKRIQSDFEKQANREVEQRSFDRTRRDNKQISDKFPPLEVVASPKISKRESNVGYPTQEIPTEPTTPPRTKRETAATPTTVEKTPKASSKRASESSKDVRTPRSPRKTPQQSPKDDHTPKSSREYDPGKKATPTLEKKTKHDGDDADKREFPAKHDRPKEESKEPGLSESHFRKTDSTTEAYEKSRKGDGVREASSKARKEPESPRRRKKESVGAAARSLVTSERPPKDSGTSKREIDVESAEAFGKRNPNGREKSRAEPDRRVKKDDLEKARLPSSSMNADEGRTSDVRSKDADRRKKGTKLLTDGKESDAGDSSTLALVLFEGTTESEARDSSEPALVSFDGESAPSPELEPSKLGEKAEKGARKSSNKHVRKSKKDESVAEEVAKTYKITPGTGVVPELEEFEPETVELRETIPNSKVEHRHVPDWAASSPLKHSNKERSDVEDGTDDTEGTFVVTEPTSVTSTPPEAIRPGTLRGQSFDDDDMAGKASSKQKRRSIKDELVAVEVAKTYKITPGTGVVPESEEFEPETVELRETIPNSKVEHRHAPDWAASSPLTHSNKERSDVEDGTENTEGAFVMTESTSVTSTPPEAMRPGTLRGQSFDDDDDDMAVKSSSKPVRHSIKDELVAVEVAKAYKITPGTGVVPELEEFEPETVELRETIPNPKVEHRHVPDWVAQSPLKHSKKERAVSLNLEDVAESTEKAVVPTESGARSSSRPPEAMRPGAFRGMSFDEDDEVAREEPAEKTRRFPKEEIAPGRGNETVRVAASLEKEKPSQMTDQEDRSYKITPGTGVVPELEEFEPETVELRETTPNPKVEHPHVPDWVANSPLKNSPKRQQRKKAKPDAKALVVIKKKQSEATTKAGPELEVVEQLERKKFVLSEERTKKCYMWFARLGEPDRETMKMRVAALPDTCDITLEEVDALPWILDGKALSVTAMTDLFLNPEDSVMKPSAMETPVVTSRRPSARQANKPKPRVVEPTPAKKPVQVEERPKVELPQKERVVLTDERRKQCYMWYSRLGQPNKETMKRKVAALPDSCEITVDEVEALPWVAGGAALSVKAMNELFLNPEDRPQKK